MNTPLQTPTGRFGLRAALNTGLGRLVQCPFDAAALELKPSVAILTKRGLTVLLMLAVSGLAGYLPGVSITLFRHLSISLLLTFGIAVAAVWLLFAACRPAVCVLAHFAGRTFQVPSGETAWEASVLNLAWSVTLLVYVCLVYGIFMRAFSPVLAALTTARWPDLVIDIGSLAVAVVALVGIFMASSPLFGKVGDSVARHVGPAPEEIPQSKCPQCGVLHPEGSRYCAFCGKALV